MATKKEQLFAEIRTLMAKTGKPVAPTSSDDVPRWKDGTARLAKDRVADLQEKIDLERMRADPTYQLEHMSELAAVINAREEAAKEESAAAAAQWEADRRKAIDDYDAKQVADAKAADAKRISDHAAVVDEYYKTGGVSPQPKGE